MNSELEEEVYVVPIGYMKKKREEEMHVYKLKNWCLVWVEKLQEYGTHTLIPILLRMNFEDILWNHYICQI